MSNFESLDFGGCGDADFEMAYYGNEEIIERGQEEIHPVLMRFADPKTGRIDLSSELAYRSADAAKWRVRAIPGATEADVAASYDYATKTVKAELGQRREFDLREQLL